MLIAAKNAIVDQLNDFIYKSFPRARQNPVEATDLLLEKGIVDSLGLLEIIGFIETTFNITVQDADVVAENFATIMAIASYVKQSITEE